MRFLADGGISPRTVEFLRRLNHDVVHVREINMQRAEDSAVLDRARA
jgi:predicted nuclease of predicted toxin-antitoxin system